MSLPQRSPFTSLRLAFVILVCSAVLQANGQDDPKPESNSTDGLDYVQSISAITGRPIFAVAGQST